MKGRINIRNFILLLVFMTGLTLAKEPSLNTLEDTVKISYWELYEQFMDLEIDAEQVVEIKTPFILQRDVGNFLLKEGKLYLCKPVEERVCAAFFSGKGNFSFTPPTEVEKQQLARFYDSDSFDTEFKDLFLIFADTTLTELQKYFQFSKGKVSGGDQDLVEYALRYLNQKKGKRFDHQIMKTFLDRDYNGFFYAHFSKKKTDPFFFEINPFSEEEVRFMRRLQGPSYFYLPELINQFHLQEDYASNIHLDDEDKSMLRVNKYVIDCTLEGSSLKFSATTELEFEARKDDQNWLFFYLFEELEVDSLFWGDGRKVAYVKEKDNPFLWVKSMYPLKAGEIRKLRLHYHGKLIERIKDWFYIKSPRNWYPKDDGYRSRAEFDVTYHIPKDFQFAGTGDMIFREVKDDVVTSRWVSGRPIPNSSFNIGFFEEHKVENDSLPPITVYMAATGHQELAHSLALQGIGSGTNMLEKVTEDVANSIELFRNFFGETADDHFYATEIPYLHGEAFPGLIHLAWRTFQIESLEGDDEIFRAHETAHQWWGIGVDFKTYHDQWLSEAFAEYCGWWYLHEVVKKEEKDEKKFYKMLERLRKEITGNRDYFFGKGKKAGPIWLGYRTLSSDTEGDFRLIIYKKGAWALHMLRSMYLDLETNSDERFKNLLRGFYQKYFDQKASTEDFQEYAEDFLGEDLDWFFRQWVYGMDVPEYKFNYEIVSSGEGQFVVRGEVEQSGVANDFQMPVIIGVDFGNDEIVPERVWVKGPVSAVEAGPYTKKPEKVIFNHLESVLCEIK